MLIVALGKQMIHSRAARPSAVGSWAASEPGRRLDARGVGRFAAAHGDRTDSATWTKTMP